LPITRFLAFSQLIAAALLALGAAHDGTAAAGEFHLSLYLAPFILGAFTALAGILLLLREPLSLYLTFCVQALQVLNIGAPIRLICVAGLKAATILSSNGIQVALGLGGEAALNLSPTDAQLQGIGLAMNGNVGWQNEVGATWLWSYSVNWIPLYFAYYIWRNRNAIIADWATNESPQQTQ
jgi:hypothetical protein